MPQKPHRPAFRIVANGDDITAAIRERFVSLSITDEAGMQSDALSLTLADTPPHIFLPSTGAELRVWLGYEPTVRYMGLFVVDGITLAGPPDSMKITARGAPFEKSGSYSELQTRRTRSWPPGTAGALVRTLAAEHGLSPAISEELASRSLQHLDQVDESDINLLTRVASDMGAVAKVGGGSLVFVKRGEGKTASGKSLPTITLTPGDVTSWSVSISGRVNYRRVVASWRDVAAAQDVEESAGEGDPVFRIRHAFPSQEAAQQAARAKLAEFQRGKRKLSLSLPGDPGLCVEGRVELVGFRKGVSGTWTVSRAEHRLDGRGYGTDVDGEE
ncbi:contractile injection system protein, VgrG/Pvc8 family [Desulfocurvus sp. DL9XJH121]